MSLISMIFQPLARYFDFQGRASRAQFWPYYLTLMALSLLMAAWVVSAGFATGAFDPAPMMQRFAVLMPIYILFGLGLFLPTYGVMVRRLHDSNRTGWWVVLPIAGGVVAQSLLYTFEGQAIMHATLDMQSKMQGMVASGSVDFGRIMALEWPIMRITLPWSMTANVISYLILWVLWALPGTPGRNRFGESPKAS